MSEPPAPRRMSVAERRALVAASEALLARIAADEADREQRAVRLRIRTQERLTALHAAGLIRRPAR